MTEVAGTDLTSIAVNRSSVFCCPTSKANPSPANKRKLSMTAKTIEPPAAGRRVEPLVGPSVVCLVSDRLPATDTINQWRDWVKHRVGSDSYSEIKHETVDRIFDAAIVGMRLAKRSRANVKHELAITLRSMAEQIDRAEC